jgi:hypothetical protein
VESCGVRVVVDLGVWFIDARPLAFTRMLTRSCETLATTARRCDMGKVSKATATDHAEGPGFAGHYGEVEGTTIGFETYSADQDPAPLFKGLPNDRCQAPHWGVVLKGSLTYRYGDGTEDVIGAGEAYYARPDHTPVFTAGTEVVEFSPTADLNRTMEVVMRNLEEMGASAEG